MLVNKKVKDILIDIKKIAVVDRNSSIKDAIDEIGNSTLGICCLIDKKNKLLGIFTDGDLRRYIYTTQKPMSVIYTDSILEIIKKKPITATVHSTPKSILKKMIKHSIWDVPVIDDNKKLLGVLHMHNLVQALI